MKITYGLLYLERIIIKGSAHYAHLKQSITCKPLQGDVKHEEHLLGFDDNGSCIREVYFRVPVRTDKESFELFLQSYPDARIIRIIDHEVILSGRQRERIESGVLSISDVAMSQLTVTKDKQVVIDLFGMPVFGQNRLHLSGIYQDQDLRWQTPATGAELEDATIEERLNNSQLLERRIKHEQH